MANLEESFAQFDFTGGLDGKASAYNAGDSGSIPGSGRSPGEGNQPTPVFLPGKSPGQRSLVVYSPWGCKESDTTERLHLLTYLAVPSEIVIRSVFVYIL